MTAILATSPAMTRFSASAVTRVIKQLTCSTKAGTRRRWLEAVAARTTTLRPDLADGLLRILGCTPAATDVLEGLTIGEVGVCYEALMATMDAGSRKSAGQYFTPDDAARFMAQRAVDFPEGMWLDPCCGVGNLAWHLTSVQQDKAAFVRDHLTLIDQDETALRTAVVMIGAEYLGYGDLDGLAMLENRAHRRDFLAQRRLPEHDFVIVNPPYARAPERPGMLTGRTRDLFAFFMEKIAFISKGFISVTPASYLAAPKFQVLRDVIETETRGGDVFVFDNVPDTLFRGYKFGSANTSKTNFVRAAITVCRPDADGWNITPIIRWRSASRERMLAGCPHLLAPRQIGPDGEWAKLVPGMTGVWQRLEAVDRTLDDLVVPGQTPYSLTVATTPRYYISAAYRQLDRGSKAVLHFATEHDRDLAAIVLNSSLPYVWWRALDGGVTLPRRVLRSLPIPDIDVPAELVERLQLDEELSLVTKLNAGKINENVKRPADLIADLNALVLPDAPDLSLLYSEDMFPAQ
ncbi:N-6 DNA methylase [Corynebacterium xerosis]|uniref:N-6 DNA methylase n=1 Tax=Corynebacterium xerosis TaxID=1725 RepID=A0ABV3UUS9_9CORY